VDEDAEAGSLSERVVVRESSSSTAATDSSDDYTTASSQIPLLDDHPSSPGVIYRRFHYGMARAESECLFPAMRDEEQMIPMTRNEMDTGVLTGEVWHTANTYDDRF
jgi:hypothetical protein